MGPNREMEETQEMNRRGRILLNLTWLLCAALTTGSMFFAVSASAQDDDDDDWEEEGAFSESGPYVNLGGSFGIQNFSTNIGREEKNKGGLLLVQNENDFGGGLNFKLGARAIEWVAYELQFEYIAKMDFNAFRIDKDEDLDDATYDRIEPNVFTTTLNIKVFPLHSVLDGVLGGRIQPYVVAGFGMLAATDTDIQTPLSMATRGTLGVDVYITPEWSIFADGGYVYTWGNLKGMDYISASLGAAYHF
jgi:hypothetical protein